MNRRISVSVALAITIIAMTVTFSITWIVSMRTFDNTMSAVTNLQAQYAKLAEIDTYVRGNFYGVIDDDYLFDRVAVGYLSGLGDRYGTYYTEQEYADLLAIESGKKVGVGIEVVRDAAGFLIVRVYEDSPAAQAGVRPGGRIVSVNGEDAANIPSMRALNSMLWDEEGKELLIHCQYDLTDEETFSVYRRANYRAPTVESIEMTDYTYIRISAFEASTYAELDYAVGQAQNSGSKGIVFDVRGASGQFRVELYEMIDLLCPRGTVAKSMNNTETLRVLATSDDEWAELPMVVLVNANTAAAGELFAVSVRDLAGGQIVGLRTAGRGSIQSTPQRLADGSAVSVTTAILYTGKDETFDGVGIEPDVEAAPVEGFDEISLFNPNPASDMQIRRAFEVAQAMVRKSGGDPGTVGITPQATPPETPPETPAREAPSSEAPSSGAG